MSNLLGIRYIGDKVSGVRVEILGSRKKVVLSTECREYNFTGADLVNDVAKKYYGGLINAGIEMILDNNLKSEDFTESDNKELDNSDIANEVKEDSENSELDNQSDSESDNNNNESEIPVVDSAESDESVPDDSTDEAVASVNADEISDDEVTEYIDTQVESIDELCTELGIKLKSRKRESQISELVKYYKSEVVVKMIESTKE